jgi:PA14 domain-containing protein
LTPRRAAILASGLLSLTGLLWYATTLVRQPTGFTARYVAGSDLSNRPAVATIDASVTKEAVRRNWPLTDQPLTAAWDGYLVVGRAGVRRFSLLSDGSSYLYVDDRLAINNTGPHGPRQVTVEISLDRASHKLRVEYSATDNPFGVDLLWASSSFASLTPLTGSVISPTTPSASEFTHRVWIARLRTAIVIVWNVLFIALLVGYVLVPVGRAVIRHHLPTGVPAPVVALLGVTALVYSVAITWGIPGQGWAPDEIIPTDFLDAFDRHFSHGWWSKYPPAHFYVCSIATTPLLVWRWLDPAAFAASPGPELLWLTFRLVTVSMGVATVLMVYVCGTYLYGAWSAFVAAAISALTLPAVYYAKIANVDVPYLFWFSISLASFLRIVVDDGFVDYLVFALTATLAVCTKDQAYGLYVLPAVALVFRRPKYVFTAGLAAAATFALCHNLLFNRAGFVAHFQYIRGPGATPFQMFDSTAAGQWELWQTVWMLARVSMGWPSYLLCLAGIVLSFSRTDTANKRLWWALLPTLSYHVAFMAVVGFTYDRFLMPMFLSLALAAGFAVSLFEQRAPSIRSWCRVGVIGLLVYTAAYVLAIDGAMLRDGRYAVEAWIRQNVEPGATVGRVGPIEHVPRIDDHLTILVIPTADTIRSTSLDYIVVNADWVERFGLGSREWDGYRELRAGRLGYRKVFDVRNPARFAGMTLNRRFEAFGTVGYSTLTKLNPPTEVFKRD